MGKFRKKPVEVEAVQFTGDNWAEMHEFTGHGEDEKGQFDIFAEVAPFTLDGVRFGAIVWDKLHATWVRVALGNWIICGVQGEFYPCAEDVFAATYEPVES